MVTPLLATKLYAPPRRPSLVPRPRLIDRLDEGLRLGCRLTLVSAPAGCGKTTLVSDWIGKSGRPVAWLSLDEGDNDPVQFLQYLIAALQHVDVTIGQSVQQLLQSPQVPPIPGLVTVLINDIIAAATALTLVLDDYHFISAAPVQEILQFLLEHQPPVLHLVISTREDPPLPLPRLRVRGQVSEVRERDLRFTAEEAAAFLNQTMGLRLPIEAVTALEARTEGWIAGLQLAALSMQGRADVSDFIAAFTGSNRYVLDYLLEEVLRRQPEDVQSFLLQTSILDRMTGLLCDALTGRADGQAMLEKLEQANLFIVPLDQDRTWYRYHHLFGEFLGRRLLQSLPSPMLAEGTTEGVSTLHSRASEWYERHGLLSEAVDHALDAQDFERAAYLIEQASRRSLMRGEGAPLLRWLGALPEALVCSRPYLGLAHAWALMIGGQLDAAELRVQEVLPAAPVQGEAAALRAILAVLRGDAPSAIELAHQALEHLPTDDFFLRGMIVLNLGLAYDITGDTTAAIQAYSEANTLSQAAGSTLVGLTAITQLGEIKMLQGRLHEAADIFQQAIRLTAEPGRQLPMAATVYLALGRLLYEWNDLEGAARSLATCIELGRRWDSADILVAGPVHLAQVRQAQGDTEGALDLIRQAEIAMQGDVISPPTLMVARAYQARLWVRQGNVEAAGRWADAHQAQAGDVSGYLGGLAQIGGTTRARVLLAQGRPEPVIPLLDQLLEAAEAVGQMGNTVELLALQARALEAQGETTRAVATLQRALAMAEPEGYVRTFVDEGPSMGRLLSRVLEEHEGLARAEGVSAGYIQKLLAAFPLSGIQRPPISSEPAHGQPVPPLVERLSERELEVLRLLAADLSSPEIADHLVVAVSTVRSHIKGIYGKLDAHSRYEAIERARALRLL